MEKKELKDLDLLDRFLFAEAIEDPETMELILEIILGREVILKHLPQAEKEQRSFLWSKQVKLDVWAKDIDDVIYDTEVQKRNTKDLPKRSRLYNSLIDSDLSASGNDQLQTSQRCVRDHDNALRPVWQGTVQVHLQHEMSGGTGHSGLKTGRQGYSSTRGEPILRE